MPRILVAPDKFKGSLSAAQAARAISEGLRAVWPDAAIRTMPIADGGEGTAAALCCGLDGEWVTVETVNPLGDPITAQYVWLPRTRRAIIEMSAASGLQLIPLHRRNPLEASTRGTGILMRHAINRGAESILIAVGGSVTNDGGAGMAAALGYEFLTSDGEPLEPLPKNLLALIAVKGDVVPDLPPIIAACDVQNPLLGPRGSSRTYGPQKGATPAMVEQLEAALENLADVVASDLVRDFRDTPGSGAAGGMGYGLLTFCNATMQSGFDLVAETLGLQQAVEWCDILFTGEGSIDIQTLDGKGPAGVAAMARAAGKPAIAFAGSVSNDGATAFDAVMPLSTRPMDLETSMASAGELLTAAAERAAQFLQAGARLG